MRGRMGGMRVSLRELFVITCHVGGGHDGVCRKQRRDCRVVWSDLD